MHETLSTLFDLGLSLVFSGDGVPRENIGNSPVSVSQLNEDWNPDSWRLDLEISNDSETAYHLNPVMTVSLKASGSRYDIVFEISGADLKLPARIKREVTAYPRDGASQRRSASIITGFHLKVDPITQ